MSSADVAERLFALASSREHAAYRITPDDSVPEIRSLIRRLAREQSVPIRTAVMGEVLAVVRKDASIWTDPVETMREKLTPTS